MRITLKTEDLKSMIYNGKMKVHIHKYDWIYQDKRGLDLIFIV